MVITPLPFFEINIVNYAIQVAHVCVLDIYMCFFHQ